MLKDCIYIPSLMKSFFSWSKLKFLKLHYLEDHGDILVHKNVNDEVILWKTECLHTHLFNIPTRILEAHMTSIFWHEALGHHSHDLMKYFNMFSDSDLILSKPKNFDRDFCLQSRSRHKLLKTIQDYMKSKFDIIYHIVHGPLAIELLGGKRYFIMFINKFS
jgi:hypothetical protein